MIPNNLITVASFSPRLLQRPSAWLGHLPFAQWVINEVSPEIFVELGTHYGHSYFSFCQSVIDAGHPTQCYAVDTWLGDDHTGEYEEEIFSYVSAHNNEHYAGFSKLLRMSFDEAAALFADKSIELLHIDGLHTYEAVRHDFETWLPKLAPGAIVMFHDTCVREKDFGVWKLWEELQIRYPNNLEFVHSHGLGVLQLNDAPDDKILEWLKCGTTERQELKDYFAALGERQQERYELNNFKHYVDSLNSAIAERNEALAQRDIHIAALGEAIVERDNIIQGFFDSISWRVTAPLRAVKLLSNKSVRFIKNADAANLRGLLVSNARRVKILFAMLHAVQCNSGGLLRAIGKARVVFNREGWKGIRQRLNVLRARISQPAAKRIILKRCSYEQPGCIDELLTDETKSCLQKDIASFEFLPLFSIVVPTYKPKPEWLSAAIESVRAQIYPHWELCIADDASNDENIRRILEGFSENDERIKVVYRENNGGISAASNSALATAVGEYVALLDHDDELAADALYWVAKELCEHPEADVIYSDEDKIGPDGNRTEAFFKPDWSPELMFNCMYTGHLTIYKKAIIQRVGGFRSEFDFSQDYDLALRITELARDIRHIPRILYHWRQTEGSAAVGDKPYARASNLAALQSAVDRRGVSACVAELPTANRVKIINWQPDVSIVIPTDSEENLAACLDALAEKTVYPSWEIIVVTNSKLADLFTNRYGQLPLTFCRYDKSYNFSDKCNEGADQSTGEIVVFFNDDVRPLSKGWLDDLIELLLVPGVGAVAPKLLYENKLIQHAGLVSGVRGLVGTAFHCRPENTTEYFNFAQSVRDVSAVSGACFAMRKCDFFDVGGFDAVNTPIMHSDVDLSFKIREKGLRCVYTPHATLLHIGHQSLSDFDKKLPKRRQDKADIFLLKRWGGYIAYDPYYTDNMRSLLYLDSIEPFMMWGLNRPELLNNHPDILIVTHDLSSSGAPKVAYLAAKHLLSSGAFPVVASPEDGPMRAMFVEIGISVIIDSLLLTGHESVIKFARNFDCVLSNTVVSWPIVRQLLEDDVPVMWYLHESNLISELAETNPAVMETLQKAQHVYVGSERCGSFCRPYNRHIKILTYGTPDVYCDKSAPITLKSQIVFSVFGTLEPRKGQDVLVEAIRLMGKHADGNIVFNFVGRSLDDKWVADLKNSAKGLNNVFFHGEVGHHDYLDLMGSTHVVVCPSRDDTLPLVTLDALSLGKVLICTDATGTADFMTNGKDGVVIGASDSEALAEAITGLIEDPMQFATIGVEARRTFLRYFSEEKFAKDLVNEIRMLARQIS